MKKRLINIFVLFTIMLPTSALAAAPVEVAGETIVVTPPPNLDDNPAGFFSFLLDKVQSGEWWPVFGLVLMLMTFVMRKWVLKWAASKWKKLEWLQTKWGGKLTLFVLATLGAVGTSIGAGKGFSASLFFTAIGIAWAASGGWEDVKDILNSFGKKEEAKKEE